MMTRANIDVAVVGIWFSSELNLTPYYPGENITINIMVQNLGDQVLAGTPVNITCVVSDRHDVNLTSSFKYIAGLAQYQTGADNLTHRFYFTPPIDPPTTYAYPHSFKVTTTANISGDQNITNNEMLRDLFVEKNVFLPRLEIGMYNATTGRPDPTGYEPMTAKVGSKMAVPFTLFNLGSASDMISLSIEKKPFNWSVSSIPDHVLGFRENTTDKLRLDLNVSSINKEALYGYDYIIRLKASSLNEPSSNFTLDVHVFIDFNPGIAIEYPLDRTYVAPGTISDLNVKLMNTGNGNDTISSSIGSLEDTLKDQGWSAYIQSGSVSPLLLLDGNSTVNIKLKVPADAHNGTYGKITFWATTNHAGTQYNRSMSIDIEVLHTFKIELEALEAIYHVYPGDAKIYFNLTNLGNDADPTLMLKVSKQPENWTRGFDDSDIPMGGVMYQQTIAIGLRLDIPSHAPADEIYAITVEAWCGVPSLKSDEVVLKFSIYEVYGLLLSAPEQLKTGDNGDTLEFAFEISNDGNVNDTYDIAAYLIEMSATEGWLTNLSATDAYMAPNASVSGLMTVLIPMDAPSDPDMATSDTIENYHVKLTVTSRNHPQTKVETTFMVKVEPRYDILLYLENTTITASGDKDGNILVPVNVTNTGNIKNMIDFTVESSNEWYDLLTIHKFIPFGEARDAIIQLKPFKGLAQGTYTFDVIGTSSKDPSITRSVRITVNIVRFELMFQNVKVNGETLESLKAQGKYSDETGFQMNQFETVIISAELVNTGSDYINWYFGDIAISFFDGLVPIGRAGFNISGLGSMEVYPVSLVYTAPAADPKGTQHNIIFKVDVHDTIPESDEGNNAIGVGVLVKNQDTTNDTEDNGGFWDLFMDYFGVTVIAIALLILVILIISALITRKRRSASVHSWPAPRKAAEGPSEIEEGPEMEEDNLELTELGDVTVSEDGFYDPNEVREFENDPDKVLEEINKRMEKWEKPSVFELAEDDLEQKLADKYGKGEISQEMYEELLRSLKGQAR